ncbi:MAG: hypothetical protein IKO32_09635 [Lachnospiraceae bacterium]|nr:hypothetical protein [Lachnospiraceae bacterium]
MNSPNLTFQPIPYNSTQEAINALSAGEVDCIFPVYFSTYDADERGIRLTDPAMETERKHWNFLKTVRNECTY